MKRVAWIFLPIWLGMAIFIWLSAEGIISKSWNTPVYLALAVLFAIYWVHSLVAAASIHEDLQKSQHPDPDVAALMDGEIDITAYRERKDREHGKADAGEPQ